MPAAITGWDEAPPSPASTSTGAWNWPPTSAETNTCWIPETSFVYTSPPVPSRAIDSPLSPVIAALGPSITIGGACEGWASAAPGHATSAAAAPTATETTTTVPKAGSANRGDPPCISCRP